MPEGLPCPARFKDEHPNWDPRQDSILQPCFGAFHYAAVSYLALNNLLGISNEPDIFKRLLAMPRKDFEKWLDGIEIEGSVT